MSELSHAIGAKEDKGKQVMGGTSTENDEDEKNKLEELKEVIKKQQDRVNGLQTTAFTLANYYFVSQAVVFTAVAGGSSPLICRDVWFPLVLSLVPALLNFFALFAIGNKYIRAIQLREENSCMLENQAKKMSKQGSPGEAERQQYSDPGLKRLHTWCFGLCMVAFGVYVLAVGVGSSLILCRRKKS